MRILSILVPTEELEQIIPIDSGMRIETELLFIDDMWGVQSSGLPVVVIPAQCQCDKRSTASQKRLG